MELLLQLQTLMVAVHDAVFVLCARLACNTANSDLRLEGSGTTLYQVVNIFLERYVQGCDAVYCVHLHGRRCGKLVTSIRRYMIPKCRANFHQTTRRHIQKDCTLQKTP
jgi:hypothetical protein